MEDGAEMEISGANPNDSEMIVIHDNGGTTSVRADFFGGKIDLKALRAACPHYPVLGTDPLVLEVVRSSYAVVTKFGGLVCWNCTVEIIDQLSKDITRLNAQNVRIDSVQDTVEVETGAASDAVEFSRIRLVRLSLANLKIISLALAQSVALEYFENRVAQALGKSTTIVDMLRGKGRLRLKEQKTIQAVGFALEIRSAVLASLTLFDDPPETWESESIAHLDAKLYNLFDLEERLSAINKKVEFLQDLNTTLLNLLSNRKSHRLEWIIIILIFIEILIFVYTELLRQ
jgi:uncharacterized Rmd1/YagE family protein